MTTRKQLNAVNKMVENGGNASRAMRDAGYSDKTAKTPAKLTKSKGFKDIMQEYGLTDEMLVEALVSDIKSKPGKRKSELELAFKINGNLNPKNQELQPVYPIALVQFIGDDEAPTSFTH